MTAIPECMTRRPTDDESRAAARRLLDAGAYDPEADMPIRLRRRPDGGAYIITEPGGLAGLALAVSAALLDATERVEELEAEVATAHDHLLAGRTICMDCEGNGFYSVQTGENDYRDDPCATCHGSCFFNAVERIAALAAEVAALRKVVAAGDALALVTDDIVDDAETPQDRERCESRLGAYRLARAALQPVQHDAD